MNKKLHRFHFNDIQFMVDITHLKHWHKDKPFQIQPNAPIRPHVPLRTGDSQIAQPHASAKGIDGADVSTDGHAKSRSYLDYRELQLL